MLKLRNEGVSIMKHNGKFRKVTASFLAASLLAVASLSGCSSTAASSQAGSAAQGSSSAGAAAVSSSAEKKVFRIALECAYAPYNWTQTDNTKDAVPIFDSNTYCNGYDIQIAKKIADSMGATLEVHKTEWTAIPTAITSGVVDAGICGMTVTKERKETLLFSDPYYKSQYVVIVKKDGKFANATSIADLKGANSTSQLSTSWYPLLNQIPEAKIQPALADVPTMLVALNSGKVDLLSCDKPTGLSAEKAYPNLKMIEFADGKGFQADAEAVNVCAALKLGNTELKAQIDKALAGISEDDRTKLMDWAISNQPNT